MFRFIQNFFSLIMYYFRAEKKEIDNEKLNDVIKRELDEWKVVMYSANPHLFKISSERVNDKRDELRLKHLSRM